MFVRRFLHALVAGFVLVTPALTGAGPAARSASAVPITAEAPPGPPGSAMRAAAEARRLGRRVPVAAEQAETRDVYANPDGSFSAKMYINPVRARRGTGWAPIDTTLRSTPSGVEPVSTTRRTVFSKGGKQPLVRWYDGSRWLELRWPAPLPEPVVSKDTATYAEVLPGVDLRMRATAQGFTKVFVVKDRVAAANPALTDLRFGLATSGLTVRSGGFHDSAGNQVFAFGAPMMWDSGTKRQPGKVMLTDRQLRLLPDRAILTAPDTKFPLYIDPPGGASRTGFNLVFSGHPDNSYWLGDGENLGKVGLCPESLNPWLECGTPYIGVARSYFTFDGRFLLGKHILQAEFNAFLAGSPSCQPRHVEAWYTNQVNPGTTWNNQPWPGGGPTNLTSHYVAAGYNSNCPGRALGWGGWDNEWWNDATDPPIILSVKNALRYNGGIITILLKALGNQDEGERDELAWKKFAHNGDTPYFTVTYNSYPNLPVNRTVENQPCAVAPNEPHINPFVNGDPKLGPRGPRLSATVSDPDGGLVAARYEVKTRGGPLLWGAESAAGGSGSTFAVDVPSAHATDGAQLSYRVLGSDGTDTSAWSSWCDVTIDRFAPNKEPEVKSTAYPECAPPNYDPCPISGGIGRTGLFTFRNNLVADVAGYRYDLHDQPSTYVAANSSGEATAFVTPPDDKPQDLHVRSVDKAGNVGPIYRYHFRVGPATPPTAHWRLEGMDETAVPDDGSNHHDGAVTIGPAQWRAGRHGDGLLLNGTTGAFVNTTNGRTVDTTKTFSVSAWVKIDRLDVGWSTAVSQDGNQISGFFLQFNPNTRKWNFMMPASDANVADRHVAESALPAVAGRWTHLVGSFDTAAKQVRIHVDGIPGTTGSHPTPWSASGTAQLGRARYNNGPTDHWPGMIDDVRIYDRLLSIEETQALVSGPAAEELFLPLDEGTGTSAIDVSGNYRSANFVGGVSWAPGRVGTRAVRLDGTGSVRSDASVRTDASFTVTAWVRLDQPRTASQMVMRQSNASSNGFELRYRGDKGVWSFSLNENGSRLVPADAGPAFDGEWTHLAGVYDAAARRIRLYVNSRLEGEAAAHSTFNVAGSMRVGEAVGASLVGFVDDVHVWTGVRTREQIEQEMFDRPTKRTSPHTGQLGRYWNTSSYHVVTTEVVPPGSHFEGSLGLMAPDSAPDTVTIYSCRNGTVDYFLAQTGCSGSLVLGKVGKLYLNPPAGVPTNPVYSCAMGGTHFASPHADCEGTTVVGLLGYAPAYANLVRSMSAAVDEHITNIRRVPAHYEPETRLGLVSTVARPGTTALRICQSGNDTFSSVQSDCEGKTAVGWTGHIWTAPPADVTGAAELFRCRTSGGELFDSVKPDCEGHIKDRSLGFLVTEL